MLSEFRLKKKDEFESWSLAITAGDDADTLACHIAADHAGQINSQALYELIEVRDGNTKVLAEYRGTDLLNLVLDGCDFTPLRDLIVSIEMAMEEPGAEYVTDARNHVRSARQMLERALVAIQVSPTVNRVADYDHPVRSK